MVVYDYLLLRAKPRIDKSSAAPMDAVSQTLTATREAIPAMVRVPHISFVPSGYARCECRSKPPLVVTQAARGAQNNSIPIPTFASRAEVPNPSASSVFDV